MEPESTDPSVAPAAGALRILHLEDNTNDRELVRDAILSSGLVCEFVYAASKEEFATALDREAPFDLILSDFTLPGYDGLQALALVHAQQRGLPYIFVSGTIGEERAIESLKSGATDYVLKDRLERLPSAMQRALREARERHRRQAAEEAMRRAEARFRNIFEHAVVGIYQCAPDGRPLDVNRTMARLCGYASPQEFCAGVPDFNTGFYVDPQRRAAFAKLLAEDGDMLGYESEIKHRDGTTLWISENTRAVRDAQGTLLYFEGIVTDITARKVAQEALRESDERFREMADSIDHVFWVARPDGREWLYANRSYERIWGRSLADLQSSPAQWLEAVIPEDRSLVTTARAQLATGQEQRIEYRIRRPDGTLCWIEDRSYPVREAGQMKRTVGVAHDITRRKQLEQQLLQAQKMEAVGQLAGGVAHDFNNVLTVVNGYARLLLDGGTLPPDAVEPLTQIYTAGARAANLTRQLLVFSRKQAVSRRILDLNDVVEEIAKMLRRLIGEHISLKLALAPQPSLVDGDNAMLEQVLMNLAVNARDAMLEGGTLTIATERIRITDPTGRHHSEARAGDFVILSVCDTGCGIPPEHLARIFEPFFTTKESGQGTGLGLATVFGVVQQHQGWIEVESTVGAGTCFRVLLPAAQEQAPMPARRGSQATTPHGGTETVLLVEDEAPVREFGAAVLRSHGYRVLQAGSGSEALDVWKWHGPRISLLFSDLVLPEGLGGIDLAARLRQEKPTLRVVLTSGYADAAIGETFRPPPGVHFIHKPYKPQVLAQTVRDALDTTFHR